MEANKARLDLSTESNKAKKHVSLQPIAPLPLHVFEVSVVTTESQNAPWDLFVLFPIALPSEMTW